MTYSTTVLYFTRINKQHGGNREKHDPTVPLRVPEGTVSLHIGAEASLSKLKMLNTLWTFSSEAFGQGLSSDRSSPRSGSTKESQIHSTHVPGSKMFPFEVPHAHTLLLPAGATDICLDMHWSRQCPTCQPLNTNQASTRLPVQISPGIVGTRQTELQPVAPTRSSFHVPRLAQ